MEKLWYTPNIQLFSSEGNSDAGETGGNDTVAGQDSAENEDFDADFDELIKNKYKKQFSKRTQDIIDKRFSQTKELEAYKEKVSDAVSLLMDRYELSPGEEDRLYDILNDDFDESYEEDYEDYDEADNLEEGEDDEEYEDEQSYTPLKERLSQIVNEARELGKEIPDFDLRKEISGSSLFTRLLLAGAPMKAAYDTVHHDEIISGAINYTAQKVKENVVNNIALKGQRPLENGALSQGAVVTSVDVNSLTSQDILKILKQVENGADIKF